MERCNRLRQAYDYLRFNGIIKTQGDIARAMNATNSNVSGALKGRQGILTDNFIIRFCIAYPCFSTAYLLTGEGEMLTDKNITRAHTHACTCSDGDTIPVPVIPRNIYEAENLDVFEYINEHDVPTSPRVMQFPQFAAYCIVYGDEMIPYFLPGDKLAISPYEQGKENKVIDGRTYLIDTRPNGLLLRTLYKAENGFRAVANNPKYPEEFVETEDIIRVYRVLGLIRTHI